VADDTSEVNALTAPEFFSRYPELTNQLLRTLPSDGDDISLVLSPSLMPVLCLLSRLSSGISVSDITIQKKMIEFRGKASLLLGSPIYKVRVLAADMTTALLDVNSHWEMIQTMFNRIFTDPVKANVVNGCLMVVKNTVSGKHELSKDKLSFVSDKMENIRSDERYCLPNKILAGDVIEAMGERVIHRTSANLLADSISREMNYITNDAMLTKSLEYFHKCDPKISECVTEHILMTDEAYSTPSVDEYIELLDVEFSHVPPSELVRLRLGRALFHPEYVIEDVKFSEKLLNNCLQFVWSNESTLSIDDQRSVVIVTSIIIHKFEDGSRCEIFKSYSDKLLKFLLPEAYEEDKFCGCRCLHTISSYIFRSTLESFKTFRVKLIPLIFTLLYDENSEIRDLAAKSVMRIYENENPNCQLNVHPNIALQFLANFLMSDGLDQQEKIDIEQTLEKMLLEEERDCREGLYSNDAFNIYNEPFQLRKILDSHKTNSQNKSKEVSVPKYEISLTYLVNKMKQILSVS